MPWNNVENKEVYRLLFSVRWNFQLPEHHGDTFLSGHSSKGNSRCKTNTPKVHTNKKNLIYMNMNGSAIDSLLEQNTHGCSTLYFIFLSLILKIINMESGLDWCQIPSLNYYPSPPLTAADTSVLLGRWQQGEKAVAVVAEVGGCWLSVSSGLCADTSLHQNHWYLVDGCSGQF